MLLTALGCTPCLRIKRILTELNEQVLDLEIEEVEFTSPAGTKLAIESGILYPPAVFVNGKLVAKGKIDVERMVATILQMDGVIV